MTEFFVYLLNMIQLSRKMGNTVRKKKTEKI